MLGVAEANADSGELAMRRLIFLGVLAVSVLFANAAEAARRVALVIGNDQYQNLPKLQKAVADAGAYADVLKAKGFDEVMLKTDLSRSQMDEAVSPVIHHVEACDTAGLSPFPPLPGAAPPQTHPP